MHEMRKCLTSFDVVIRTRTSKLLAIISPLTLSSLPFYTFVCVLHNNQASNGILFQMLPKIRYFRDISTACNSIFVVDEYANHNISPEELRYTDYMIHMKTQRHQGPTLPQTVRGSQTTSGSFNFGAILAANNTLPLLTVTPSILHSLPINYPYDESKLSNENRRDDEIYCLLDRDGLRSKLSIILDGYETYGRE